MSSGGLLFQITTSRKRVLKGQGLVAAMDALKKRRPSVENCQIWFVVPKSLAAAYKRQKVQGRGAGFEKVRKLEQFVASLDLSS